MKQYLKVFWVYLGNGYRRDMLIPGFVVNEWLFRFTEIGVALVFFDVIFSNTGDLGGWSYYQILFLYGFAQTLVYLISLFFRNGIRRMASELIRTGEFDFFLTKPLDSMILVSISKPRVYEIATVIFYVGLALYALLKTGSVIHIQNLVWFLLLAICALVLIYFMQILFVVPAFWLVQAYHLQYVFTRVAQFMRYPATIFPRLIKIALFTLIPILAASYLPAYTLLFEPRPIYIAYMLGITIVFTALARFLWRLGERSYLSASS